ncbi:unnamed protein product, partial [Phaeothamnion confervicola]
MVPQSPCWLLTIVGFSRQLGGRRLSAEQCRRSKLPHADYLMSQEGSPATAIERCRRHVRADYLAFWGAAHSQLSKGSNTVVGPGEASRLFESARIRPLTIACIWTGGK